MRREQWAGVSALGGGRPRQNIGQRTSEPGQRVGQNDAGQGHIAVVENLKGIILGPTNTAEPARAVKFGFDHPHQRGLGRAGDNFGGSAIQRGAADAASGQISGVSDLARVHIGLRYGIVANAG